MPTPYNITISDDSPTLTYSPYRDGPLTGGWNLTCSGSDDSTYSPQNFCVGSSSHRTSYTGASISLQFEGTAAYIYGTAPAGSYVLQVDNNIVSSPNSSPGLLARVEGLTYALHTVVLNVTQSTMVSFSEVVLTVGLDTDGSSAPKNRTIGPFTVDGGPPTENPLFSYSGTWISDYSGEIGVTGTTLYPRRHTSQQGATVTFTLNETSAFFVYGLVNLDLGPFTVGIQPPPAQPAGAPVTTTFNSSSRWISLDQVMYWQSGLDRSKQYTVTITNQGTGDAPWFDFSHIDVIDGEPNGSSNGGLNHKQGLSKGAIGGIIAGAVALVLVLLALFLTRKRIKRTIYPEEQAPSKQYVDYMPPTLSQDDSNQVYGSLPYETTPMLPTRTSQSSPQPSTQQAMLYAAPSVPQAPVTNNTLSLPRPPVPGQYTNPSASPMPYTHSNQGSLVALSWNEEQGSNNIAMTDDRPRKGPPRIVQEEDAGGVFSPSENVVRLPPGYQDSWVQGR
ncbi:hypothetical protein CVT26_009889 [Gymnopilus dilepis]|uniref:Uncharacterized protein n=1 Tax=Gymnopilus dilepis TaxID=231916 RepID=A0A409YC12_9AGAR|nr:hypothetical protein CVT26_009889 [Gymnopilus dilepis]